MFKGSGRLIYDPDRGKVSAPWWAILEVDEELRRYYASFYEQANNVKLIKPQWPAHISVVKGEEPLNKKNWMLHNNRKFIFYYDPEQLYDDLEREKKGYVWLKVLSEELAQVREELGLSAKLRDPKTGFQSWHVTLGRLFY